MVEISKTDETQTQPADSSELAAETAPSSSHVVSRSVAIFLGLFILLELFGNARTAPLDRDLYWIDIPIASRSLVRGFLAFAAMLLVGFAVRPKMSRLRFHLTRLTTLVLFGATIWNSAIFYRLLKDGHIRTDFPLPFSLHLGVSLVVIFVGMSAQQTSARLRPRDFFLFFLTFVVCAVSFPLALMYCFGKTDYRQPADVIVVFGSRAYADGRPSEILAERVRTGCRLYHDGFARKLILSGGPGDGDVHETEAMQRLAMELGVPQTDILLDKDGINTAATVANTTKLLEDPTTQRVLAVSHFYHLPRIKLCFSRSGATVFTVPAEVRHSRDRQWFLLAREVAAIWVYYFLSLKQILFQFRPRLIGFLLSISQITPEYPVFPSGSPGMTLELIFR